MGEEEADTRERSKREHVAHVQRARILSAMAEISGERGPGQITVADVVSRAGVSRRTFYELFDDCESCRLSAIDEALARLSAYVLEAYDQHASWRERIRASLVALLQFIEEEPSWGGLLIVESYAAGHGAEDRRARVLGQVIGAVDGGREQIKGGNGPPPLSAEGIVGGALFVLYRRIIDPSRGKTPAKGVPDAPTHLVELTGPLMSMIVLPYLGAAAARAELARPVPAARIALEPPRDSLTELEIRLTYRTTRVLSAIGAHPESSNRQIGRAAGAADPGQISRLLSRLQRLGLVENSEGGGVKGRTNSWSLTHKGSEVERAIARYSGVAGGRFQSVSS